MGQLKEQHSNVQAEMPYGTKELLGILNSLNCLEMETCQKN